MSTPLPNRRAFSVGETIAHWILVAWERSYWQARCLGCGALQWIQLRKQEYVPRCRSCGRSPSQRVSPVRPEYLVRPKYLTGK
jgi:hypothetical protein